MAVAGSAFILATIWKNPRVRTPSYVLLAALAFTDFFTELSTILCQPFYVVYRMQELSGNFKMSCIAGVIAQIARYYFPSLTDIVMAIIAVERWLHMS